MVSPIENLKNSLRIRILVWEIKIKLLVFTTNHYFSPIFLCFISQTGGNKELNQKDPRKYNNNLITIVSSCIRNTSNTIWVNKHGSNSLIVTLGIILHATQTKRWTYRDGMRKAHNFYYKMSCGQKPLDMIDFSLEILITFFEKFKAFFSFLFYLPQWKYHYLQGKSTRF